MKKSILVFVTILFTAIFALPVFSALTTPIAKVQLTSSVIIPQQQLDAKVKEYEGTYQNIDEATILDAMISDILITQALERDGFVMTEEQKDSLLAYYRANISASFGVELDDSQFEYVIMQNYGVSVADYREYIAQQYVIESYVTALKNDMFTNPDNAPTNAEIESFYKKNSTSFISAEKVKLSHIFFNFGDGQYKKAFDVATQINAGKITFEKAVTQYSEDEDSINSAGEIGWLAMDDSTTMTYMGENFFDKVFDLDAGEIRGVIENLAGYHIVKVTVHNNAKILSIDDKINPADTTTVREYIYNYLYELKLDSVFQSAYLSVISDLKNQATIKYLK